MTDTASRYDYDFDPHGDSTAARVCRLVGRDRHVLELGCAAGAMTAVLRSHYECRVTGLEYDAKALEHARPFCDAAIQADLDDDAWPSRLPQQSFDTVLAADVLEHLRDPLQCLRQIHGLLGSDGELVVSVPNIAHSGVIAALLSNDFPYRDIGLLDRTHVYFFTSLTLGQMLHDAGFQVTHTETVNAGAEHPEFRAYWQNLPADAQAWLAQHPAGQPYQIIMRARAVADAGAYTDALHTQTLEHLSQNHARLGPSADAAEAQPSQDDVHALHEAQQQARDAEQRARAAEATLHDVKASRSWRLTAPLRWLIDALKR